jgi:L-rhamnose isomerase
VILNDEVKSVAEEIVRAGVLDRVNISLDFFDGSLNRVGAYVIGARSTLKSLLIALLEPTEKLRKVEEAGDNFARLAMLEELKTLPFGAVWDYYCLKNEVAVGEEWIEHVHQYEKAVLKKRD